MSADPRYVVLVLAFLTLAMTVRFRVRQNRRRAQYRGRR